MTSFADTLIMSEPQRVSVAGEQESMRASEAESLASLARARILMIDDDPIMTEVVHTFLNEAGYHAFTAINDPREGLRRLERALPDVLLLDLHMPGGLDGFDVLTAVRADERTRYLPVIVMTSASDAPTKLKALDLGATDFLEKPVDPSELALRLRNTLAFKAYRDRLEYFDPVTSLPNQRRFLQMVGKALPRARLLAQPMAVLWLQFDQAKRIGESLGGEIHDEMLRACAQRLNSVMFDSPIVVKTGKILSTSHWKLARTGADEFALLLADLCDPQDATSVAQRIYGALRTPFDVEGHELYLDVAIGVAGTPVANDDAVQLCKNAAVALSQARKRGPNTLAYYARALDDVNRQSLSLEIDLRRAIAGNELELYLQPKVDLVRGCLFGAEALLRWNHPVHKLLTPDRFVGLAEERGLIVQMGDWVLNEACRRIRRWQDLGLPLSIAVNVSALQLLDTRFVSKVERAITSVGVSPGLLTIELTESSLVRDAERVIEVLRAVREMGVRVSMDDFGTGYSSLSYLRRLPLNELKVDRTFMADVPSSPQSAAIMTAILSMARTLGLMVVAEGVEQPAQLDYLRNHGCDAFQGYLCSPPLPPDRFEERVRRYLQAGSLGDANGWRFD